MVLLKWISFVAHYPLQRYSWPLAVIQGLFFLIAYWLFLSPPSPGIAVAILGLVAIVMAIRVEEEWGRTERVLWLSLATFLMIVEISAIQLDRDKHEIEIVAARQREESTRKEANESFTTLLKEGEGLFKHQTKLSKEDSVGHPANFPALI